MQYFDSLLQYRDLGVLLLRLLVGYLFIYHGWPKLVGGKLAGYDINLKGFAGWLGSMGFPIPMVLAVIVAVVEVFGGLGLVLGVGVQLAAALLAIDMAVATWAKIVKMKKGFAGDGGFELDLVLLAVCVFLAVNGAGVYALWR